MIHEKTMPMGHFDIKARTWDENPEHHERSKAIAEKMLGVIPVEPHMVALEFGAGTGILSFLLKDKLAKIILMDSSPEMVRVCQEKIARERVTNLYPIFWDLEQMDFHTEAFDIIFSQMVFHHITNVRAIVQKLHSMLKEGGYVAIADLYKEDGSFHGEDFDGHKGFEPDELAKIFESVGFKKVRYETCYTMVRKTESETHEYPVFLLTGQK